MIEVGTGGSETQSFSVVQNGEGGADRHWAKAGRVMYDMDKRYVTTSGRGEEGMRCRMG